MRFGMLMSWALSAFLVLAAPSAVARAPLGQTVWFYSAADSGRSCAVTDAAVARVAAANPRFASGASAMMRVDGRRIVSVVVMTQSEDAYVEDTYVFDDGVRVSALVRRGQYADDPFVSVRYRRSERGGLVLSPVSRRTRVSEEQAGHETYFLDWPRFRTFEALPFSGLVDLRTLTIRSRC